MSIQLLSTINTIVSTHKTNYERIAVNKLNDDFSFESEVTGKDISVKYNTTFTIGKNSGDTLTVGTLSEVKSGSKDLTTQVAAELIARKYAIQL